ncbi:MAG: hypothetical protein AAF394_16020, partial [Planctomycetota bacterium]
SIQLAVITDSSYQTAIAESDFPERTLQDCPRPMFRLRLHRLLRLLPRFKRNPYYKVIGDEKDSWPISAELEFAGNDFDATQQISKLLEDDNSDLLARNCSLFLDCLKDAVDWLAFLNPSQESSFTALLVVGSIDDCREHKPGRDHLKQLITLCLAAIRSKQQNEPDELLGLLSALVRHGQALTQRVALFALAEANDIDPELGADLLLSPTQSPLRQRFFGPELEHFLRRTSGRIPKHKLDRIVQLLLQTAPGTDANPESEERLRERIGNRLDQIKRSGAELSSEGEQRLAKHLKQTSKARLEAEKAKEDEEPLNLRELSLSKIVQLLSADDPSALSQSWVQLIDSGPRRALNVLRSFSDTDIWPEVFWRSFVDKALLPWQSPLTPNQGRLRCAATKLLLEAPDSLLRSLVGPLCSLAESATKDLSPQWHDAALQAIDRLWPLSLPQPDPLQNTKDVLWQAINHPSGHLAQGLLNLLSATAAENRRPLPADLARRMEQLIEDGSSTKPQYARIVFARHLNYLFFLDSAWATEWVVPLFSAKKNKAVDAWHAFLHSPQFTPRTLELLSDDLIECFNHRERLPPRWRKRLVRLVGTLGIENLEWISETKQRGLIHSLDEEELYELACHMSGSLRDDPESAAELWTHLVEPWFKRFWPKDKAKRSAKTSAQLAKLALRSKGELRSQRPADAAV